MVMRFCRVLGCFISLVMMRYCDDKVVVRRFCAVVRGFGDTVL